MMKKMIIIIIIIILSPVCRVFTIIYLKQTTNMRRITTFRSTTDRIYDGGPIRFFFKSHYRPGQAQRVPVS